MKAHMIREAKRVPTGVQELDAILRGGLLLGRTHLIEGRPGTGKTTLGLCYLMNGVASGASCLYLTLSETVDELHATAESHGWSLDGIQVEEMMPVPRDGVQNQTILLPTEMELTALVNRIADHVAASGAERVVIDSMVEVRLLARDSAQYRRQILELRRRLSELSATVLLLDDMTSDGREYELQSAVHAVITLEQLDLSFGAVRRRLRIAKLRGGDFQSGWHDYAIKTSEILVFPSLIAQEHHRVPLAYGALSRVKGLDRLMGGPLTAGSSTMVLGPSGVGKSTLALQYGVSMVRAGHHVGYFTFDESEVTLRSRLVTDVQQEKPPSEPSLLHIERINPSRISPGEFIWKVRRLVEDQNARLIIIDSINSYLDVIRQEKSLLLQMNELFSYLSNMHVMSIVVGAHSARLDTSKEPDALSIITDNIISLRYYEQGNVVQKAISVLKKRQGPHGHDICALNLTDAGIEVGDRISAPDGQSGELSLEA
jgi:circadian clock protein KaiC